MPSLTNYVTWQVSTYYVAFLLIELQGLKWFLKMQCSGNGHPHQKLFSFGFFWKQKTKDHLLEVKIETYKKQYFHLKGDFAYIEVSRPSP